MTGLGHGDRQAEQRLVEWLEQHERLPCHPLCLDMEMGLTGQDFNMLENLQGRGEQVSPMITPTSEITTNIKALVAVVQRVLQAKKDNKDILLSSVFSSTFGIDTGAEAHIIHDRQLFHPED
jgi:hypothetical protein